MKLSWTPSASTETFENFDTLSNPTLIEAKTTLETLAEQIIASWGNLWVPLIVWIQGNPWVGKTHLIRAFQNKLIRAGVKFHSNKDDKYLITQNQRQYNKTKWFIVVIDDFLQGAISLEQAKKDWDKWGYDLREFPQFLFDLYEMNGICLISSNFDINKILELVTQWDTVWRLKSRVNELLWSVQPIHIISWDYREVRATKTNPLKAAIQGAVQKAVEGKEWQNVSDSFSELRNFIKSWDASRFLDIAQEYSERWWTKNLLSSMAPSVFPEDEKYSWVKQTAIKIFFNTLEIGNTQIRYTELKREFQPDKYTNWELFLQVIEAAKKVIDSIPKE